jgi:polysaccharide biosynthesis transport protein
VIGSAVDELHWRNPGSLDAPVRPHDPGSNLPGRARGGGLALDQVVHAARNHRRLVLASAVLAVAASGALASRRPELYRAVATIRLPDARRALVENDDQPASAELERMTDPLLSAIQVFTSRGSIGEAVDSLGLRLVPIRRPTLLGAPLGRPRIWRSALEGVVVDSSGARDTLNLRFDVDRVVVEAGSRRAQAPYGRAIRLPIRQGVVHFVVPEPPPVAEADAEVISRDRAIDRVLDNLKVVARPSTDVVDVSYTGSDPTLSQRLVNRLVRTFQETSSAAAHAQARRRREVVAKQLQRTDAFLARAEARLIAMRVRQPLASSLDRAEIERTVVAALDSRRGEAETDRLVYQQLLQKLESRDASKREEGLRALAYSPEVTSDRVLERLHQQLLDYRRGLDSLTTGPWRSAPTNPDVIRLVALVRGTEDEFARALRARLDAADARSQALADLSAQGSAVMQTLPANQLEEARLRREVEALRTSSEELRPAFEKARLDESLQTANIQILDLAPLPYRPVGVPAWVLLIFGTTLGLFAGAGLAVLADSNDARIRVPEDLPGSVAAPGLGVIPRVAPVRAGLFLELGTASLLGPRTNPRAKEPALSVGIEAFRMLGMRLAFGTGRRPGILLITSAAPQEGKTLIAANLAATYARGGAKVLLVDGDLKRPRLHRLFRVPPAPGFMEMLHADAAASDPGYTFAPGIARGDHSGPLPAGVHRTAHERLYVLPRGKVPPDSSELLQPARIEAWLRRLANYFEIIIVDTPPVLVSADAATLAPAADSVLLVVRAGQTHRDAAALAYEQLTAAGGRVVGAVVNDPTNIVTRYRKFYYTYDYPAIAD